MSASTSSVEEQSQARKLGIVVGLLGAASIGMTNRIRHRPIMYQPWLHLIAAGVGGYLGLRLGAVYDDTSVTLRKQAAGYKSLPSWAYSQLSPEELAAEMKEQRLAELQQKVVELAELEEKEYLEAQRAKQ